MGAAVITFLILWPMAAAGILLLIRGDRHNAIRGFALAASLVEFFASLFLLFAFQTNAEFQFTARWTWKKELNCTASQTLH